jgi:hypothetical protein
MAGPSTLRLRSGTTGSGISIQHWELELLWEWFSPFVFLALGE